jgi:hypothetical protein
MLLKAYGIEPDTSPAENFTDAGNTWYTGYLAAAKSMGIATGVGDNLFAPEREVTREEMFTLLYNVLKAIDKLPEGNTGTPLAGFSDAGQVDAWAIDAITKLTEAGIVGGIDGRLAPADTATRAQMAQLLYKLLS